MGFSENPKFSLLINKLIKKSKVIGTFLSIVGVIFFLVFNKFNKNAELDARTFTQFVGNSVLNKKNEKFFNDTNLYFLNYKYEGNEDIIKMIYDYINEYISSNIQHEMVKIKITDTIEQNILISNVGCKYCNNMESLVVVINFDFKERKFFHSLVIGLTLIEHFSKCNYMSKDVIFLFTNKELLYSLGIQEFIQKYFYNNTNIIGKKIIRSSTIIEFDSIYPSNIKINYEGLNGMLPNQDLILLLTNELHFYSIPIKMELTHGSIFDMALEKNYEHGHIYFLRENIPSFTATGVSKVPIRSKMINLFNLTKALQSYLRSQSNTHEGFCHSSNFYFFNTFKRHIPISIYCYSVYLICAYTIMKLFKSATFRSYVNFLTSFYTYLITILIISLPIYLISTNKKFNELLNFKTNYIPKCQEWHPDNFDKYIKIASIWWNVLFFSIIVAFFFNLFISFLVNKKRKIIQQKNDKNESFGGYKKVERVERILILEKIKQLQNEIMKRKGITNNYNNHIKNYNNILYTNENIYNNKNNNNNCENIYNNGEIKKNILVKPKIINSDDEDFLLEKKNSEFIKKIEKQIEILEEKLEFLSNDENVRYIFYNNSIAPFNTMMIYMNIFYFILVVILSSLYNWSYSVLFSMVLVIPISLLNNIRKKTVSIFQRIVLSLFILFMFIYMYPNDNHIWNLRQKLTNLLGNNLSRCCKYLDKHKILQHKYFPESLQFICSNKLLDSFYVKKYFLDNLYIKFNYILDIQNGFLLTLYNIARNHFCIGTATYPLICFTLLPILFYIAFLFFC
ncbi:putative glycosylphosphatidylinositol anchor attachment 1 protein [Plasmodium gaboni]|uniref:Putative glycosylphosphatidylinositol anchor attachment 1 protein n=1 Tax=Plasmodium gaboni TaxID=647221 RepID=A0A151LEQ3_9APIC|nr:putative glycosylphosphatidylinositol anchor attachment 1 protein [Plasmodium gaboni]KYN97445.1 putative glycosylphosphatidylinositol anchor attachment 1 protein [Plasmodium gaboni]